MATSSAGAISVLISADTASFDSAMSKVGAMAERELKRVEKAQLTAKNEGERFIAMVKKQADTFGLTGTALLAYEARLKGVSAQTQPYIDKLNQMKSAQDAVNASVRGIGAGEGIKANAHEMEGFSFATAGAKRELLVLGHELSQGNYKRFAGSLLVLGERTGAASLLFSAMGLSVLGASAAVSLFAAAAFKGAQQTEELRKSLVLTGNYAGITEGQFNALARTLATSTGSSIGKTREALQALISTGEIGPRVLGPLAQAVVLYAKASGETEEAVAKDFAKMSEGVVKFAADHNHSMNFITLGQRDQIKALEDQGKAQEAQLMTANLVVEHFKHLNESQSETIKFWNKLKQASGEAWDEMLGNGRAETAEDRLAKVNKQIASLDAANRNLSKSRDPKNAFASANDAAVRPGLEQQRTAELYEMAGKARQAYYAAEDAIKNKVAIASKARIESLQAEFKVGSKLELDLQQLKKDIANTRAGGGIVTAKEASDLEAAIRHRDRSHADKAGESEAKKLANSIRDRLNLYAEETAKLKAQEEEYAKYGKLQDKMAEAIARVDVATGKFAKATTASKNAIIAAAKVEDIQAAKTKATEEAMKSAAAAVKKRAEQLVILQRRLDDNAIATDSEIEHLKDETKYLGLNTLARRIANEERKIEKESQRELVAHPADFLLITGSADKRKISIAQAMTEAEAATKSFGFGAKRAFDQYEENAANAAKYAEQFVSGSLQRTEDALVSFVKTGKLNLSSLFTYMADEYLRNQIRMQIAKFTSGGSDSSFSLAGIVGSIGKLFGGGGAGATASFDAGSGWTNVLGGRAAGGPVSANSSYLVGENGPEVLRMGSQSGAVIPNGVGSGGQVIHFDFSGGVTNVGQGVSRGEVSAAVQQGNAQTETRIRRLLRNGSV